MSDVGRKAVPDKGRLNRERPVTKALEFPFCTGKRFNPLKVLTCPLLQSYDSVLFCTLPCPHTKPSDALTVLHPPSGILQYSVEHMLL